MGCSGGAGEPGNGSTTLLINSTLCLEAGSGLLNLPAEQLLQIDSVILSHSHFDHVCGLPFLVELRKQQTSTPLKVFAHAHTIEVLKTHFFNEQVWPNFMRIPSPSSPALQMLEITANQSHRIAGLDVVPVKVNHTVPALGFLIGGKAGSFAYSGDTFACDEFMQALTCCPTLRHVIMECSFPENQRDLAQLTQHLHTEDLRALRLRLPGNVPLWATSTKPWYKAQIEAELACNGGPATLQCLRVGQKLTF